MDIATFLRINPFLTDTRQSAVGEQIIKDIHHWRQDSGNRKISVAIMDTGIDSSHPVFEGTTIRNEQIVTGNRKDDVGHGTACAGLIKMLAPEVEEFIDLRVFGGQGRGDLSPLYEAYQWLLENPNAVDLCNISLGTNDRVDQLDHMHNRLVQAGQIIPVIAAGNTGGEGGSPATAQLAFSVGAITAEERVADFSSYNPNRDNPDISALGKNIRLPQADGTSMGQPLEGPWVMASGTSFSCPITVAAMAKRLSYGETSQRAIDKLLTSTADNIPETPRDGDGILKLEPALEKAGLIGKGDGSRQRVEVDIYSYSDSGNFFSIDEKLFEQGTYRGVYEEGTLKISE
jgi:subtilisin family serine protease